MVQGSKAIITLSLLFVSRDIMADQGSNLLPKNVRRAVTRVTEKLFVDNHAQGKYHGTRDVRRGKICVKSISPANNIELSTP